MLEGGEGFEQDETVWLCDKLVGTIFLVDSCAVHFFRREMTD